MVKKERKEPRAMMGLWVHQDKEDSLVQQDLQVKKVQWVALAFQVQLDPRVT